MDMDFPIDALAPDQSDGNLSFFVGRSWESQKDSVSGMSGMGGVAEALLPTPDSKKGKGNEHFEGFCQVVLQKDCINFHSPTVPQKVHLATSLPELSTISLPGRR